jgi:AraC family transcriptional regulator
MHVEIKQIPELRLAAVRHRGTYHEIGQAFGRLGQIAGRAGLFKPGAAMIALYHDDPQTTPAEQLTSDAAVTVPPDAPIPDGLAEARVPSGAYATAVHVGPYEHLDAAWEHLKREWLPASGLRRREDAPSHEVYLNDPSTTPKERLETEIRLPVM